jgi:DNA-binding NarL/FixJ family response regulator
MKFKIILADDHKMMQKGLHSLLENQSDFEVVGEAADGRTAVNLAKKLKPDIVLMDVSMPEMNGIEATSQIVALLPGVKIIALSMHSELNYVKSMLKAGASGYLLKECAFEELILALNLVMQDQMYLSPKISDIIAKDYLRQVVVHQDSTVRSILTVRECEVLQLMAEGKTTKEISTSLNISVKTVETHRQQVMSKLNIHSIAGLTKFAIREGLTSL